MYLKRCKFTVYLIWGCLFFWDIHLNNNSSIFGDLRFFFWRWNCIQWPENNLGASPFSQADSWQAGHVWCFGLGLAKWQASTTSVLHRASRKGNLVSREAVSLMREGWGICMWSCGASLRGDWFTNGIFHIAKTSEILSQTRLGKTSYEEINHQIHWWFEMKGWALWPILLDSIL